MLKIYYLLLIFPSVKSEQFQYHHKIVTQYYQQRKTWATSNLGSILFKNQNKKITSRSNVTYVVLIWKYFDYLKYRHINKFSEKRHDPLDQCDVKNCKFIGSSSKTDKIDAVVVHLHHGIFPKKRKRNSKQIWIFWSDESPTNAFSRARNPPNLKDMANIFNWSMTYRTDSDIPTPYGRTVALRTPLIESDLVLDTWPEIIANYVPYWNNKTRDVLVTVLMSNCKSEERMDYLDDLQNYIDVDFYGQCSEQEELRYSCPRLSGHNELDCREINKYLFYLAFENSNCRQYVTEKSFNNAYAKGAIPIIMGPSREDCVKLLPPNSFLHVDDFASPEDLADEIFFIASSNKSLLAYHRWRNNFEVRNEHGFFGIVSHHYCRICEALNINKRSTKVYDADSLRIFLDPKILCD